MTAAPVPRARGVTLVELIVFIVVIGIVAVGLMLAFSRTLRATPINKEMTLATQLAQERMELILAQRDALGYAGFTASTYDPCQSGSAHPACTNTFGDTVTPGFADNGTNKVVTVTVAGASGNPLASLTSQVFGY